MKDSEQDLNSHGQAQLYIRVRQQTYLDLTRLCLHIFRFSSLGGENPSQVGQL